MNKQTHCGVSMQWNYYMTCKKEGHSGTCRNNKVNLVDVMLSEIASPEEKNAV